MAGVRTNHGSAKAAVSDGNGGEAAHAPRAVKTAKTIHRATPAPTNAMSPAAVNAAIQSHAIATDERPDEQLLEAYRAGDKSSFATLVSRYQRELFHFLIRFLGDRAAAEDIFQESFLQVHQSIDSFDTSRRFRPWLFTIAANKARDLIRSQARRPASPLQASISPGDDDSGEYLDLMQSSQAFPDEPIQRQELQASVQRVVTSMPENLREILLLSYFHQFPYKQISDILDIPLGTVKSRLHAAVAYFADRWRNLNQNTLLS